MIDALAGNIGWAFGMIPTIEKGVLNYGIRHPLGFWTPYVLQKSKLYTLKRKFSAFLYCLTLMLKVQ